jgi:hypothetical protein
VAHNFLNAHTEPRDLSSNFLSPFAQSYFNTEQGMVIRPCISCWDRCGNASETDRKIGERTEGGRSVEMTCRGTSLCFQWASRLFSCDWECCWWFKHASTRYQLQMQIVHIQCETCKVATRIFQQKYKRCVQAIFSVFALGNKKIFTFFSRQFLYSFQTNVKFSGRVYYRYPIPYFVKNIKLMRFAVGRTQLYNYLHFNTTHVDGKIMFFDMKRRVQTSK